MIGAAAKPRQQFASSASTTPSTIRRVIGGSKIPGGDHDTERAQAIVRLVLTIVVASYMTVGITGAFISEPAGRFLLSYFVFFFFLSAAIFFAIRRWPGVYHSRRAFCMFLDFGSLTMSMVLGAAFLAPLYALLLWVTVGYGMRYGSRYLGAATVCALLSLTSIVMLSDYWQQLPYIVATLYVTAIIVPLYAHALLADTRKAYRVATAANLAKSQFLAQASHDLRQPIHAISLFTACLKDADIGQDERQMVENIDRSLQSVARLFRSLLDVATLDSGRLTPQDEVVAVESILHTVAAQNAEAAKRAGVDLRIAPSSARVHCDANLLTVILQNLVSNALKYAPAKPVLIGCRRRGATLSIVVVDRGHGISPEHQAHVFGEFYRVRRPGRDVEGVGLGLSIVRRMAHLMGLTVSLRSAPGKGTAISIDGLRLTSEPVALRKNPRKIPVSLIEGMRILLIEDDHEVLAATKTLLERWGCRVQAEPAPPDRIEPCDLILADFDLNCSINGGDCIRSAREQEGGHIRAIIMTGHDDGHIRAELDDLSIPVLSKPVRPAELRASLLSEKLKADQVFSGMDRRTT